MGEGKTNEFSFVLNSTKHGVGVFAAHDITKGTYLRLFGDEKLYEHRIRILDKRDVPEVFHDYCMDRGDTMVCPEDFGCMPIGWYLNHSNAPNAVHENYNWYALKNIKKGEEILINYNDLEEPEKSKAEYYRQLS